MTSFLRQLVAGPRKGHAEAGLDLCYVTDHIIATSGPSQTYPKRAYRNPLDQLVAFLDRKHGEDWAIWEFRAEGTGYPDHLVYDRICHFPYPDHHPPPFRLMPLMLASMRNWLHGGALQGGSSNSTAVGERGPKRVVVVHCKAGKGRSGTASVSYLIAEEGWTAEDALARFTERRMRPMFGAGISIPSQLRWVSYVDRWTKHGKKYRDRPIEIVEIHAWGLRNGVRVDVEGFVDDGKKIHSFYTFKKNERHIVEGSAPTDGGITDLVWDIAGYPPSATKAPEQAEFAEATNNKNTSESGSSSTPKSETTADIKPPQKSKTELIPETPPQNNASASRASTFSTASKPSSSSNKSTSSKKSSEAEPGGMAVIFRPATPIRIPNSDVNISVERRNRTHKSIGLTMVSAVAHVWFNTFFEGNGPEQDGEPDASGVFTIEWDAMDGIKGTSKKGSRGLDKMSVVWRFADAETEAGGGIKADPTVALDTTTATTPAVQATDGKEAGAGAASASASAAAAAAIAGPDVVMEKDLGLRSQSPASADISRASSVLTADLPRYNKKEPPEDANEEDLAVLESVKTSDPSGEELRSDAAKS